MFVGMPGRLIRRLIRTGLRRGILEGSVPWVAVAAFAGLVQLLLRAEKPKVVTEELRIGESILVTHVPGPSAKSAARGGLERDSSRRGGPS